MKFSTLKFVNNVLSKFTPFKIKTDTTHERFIKKINYNLLCNVYGEESLKEKKFLNFGAGYRFNHFAFRNVDKYNGDIDLKWSPCDFKKINIKDKSIKVIYTSHMIEHLTFEEAKFMLSEFYRILETNGQLRIVTPDIDIFHEAYVANDKYLFNEKLSIEHAYVKVFAARLIKGNGDNKPLISSKEIRDLFNKKKRTDAYEYLIEKVNAKNNREDWFNHISWWNFERLNSTLKEAGFSSVFKSAYSQSKSVVLKDIRYFDQTAQWYSLYVDAIK